MKAKKKITAAEWMIESSIKASERMTKLFDKLEKRHPESKEIIDELYSCKHKESVALLFFIMMYLGCILKERGKKDKK